MRRDDPDNELSGPSQEVRDTYREFYDGTRASADRFFVAGFFKISPSECENRLIHLSDSDIWAPPDAGIWLDSLWDRGTDVFEVSPLRDAVRAGTLADGKSCNYVVMRDPCVGTLLIFSDQDLDKFGEDAVLTTEGELP